MQFSEKQRRRIYTYLAQVEDALIHEPPEARRDILRELKRVIAGRLRDEVDGNPKDEDIETVLGELGTPDACASRIVAQSEKDAGGGASARVWLGVCASAAARMGVEARYVRLAVLALGVVLALIYVAAQVALAPLLVIAYIIAYAALRYTKPASERRRIEYWDLLNGAGLMLLLLIGLETLTQLLLFAIPAIYTRFAARPLELDRTWLWLDRYHTQLFVHALLTVVPFAILARLPVPPGWDRTLAKTSQAFAALYGLALSYGFALLLAGAIIEASQHLTGFGGLDLLN